MPELPDTVEPTREMIEIIIATKNTQGLLGIEETEWLEFHWHYATDANDPAGYTVKHELAKDCSSIANYGGGYLFVGVKTAKLNIRMTDYDTDISGIDKSMFNL